MTQYIALLRGVNVSGQKLIKMEVLRKLFSSYGFKNVQTYIQSGNVIFESEETDANILATTIRKNLLGSLGFNISIIVRTVSHFKELVESNPFESYTEDVKLYVSFLTEDTSEFTFPIIYEKDNIELIEKRGVEIFSVGGKYGNRYGFPNMYIEKKLKIDATTRNWNSVTKILEKALK